jgi:hypothetical protein
MPQEAGHGAAISARLSKPHAAAESRLAFMGSGGQTAIQRARNRPFDVQHLFMAMPKVERIGQICHFSNQRANGRPKIQDLERFPWCGGPSSIKTGAISTGGGSSRVADQFLLRDAPAQPYGGLRVTLPKVFRRLHWQH